MAGIIAIIFNILIILFILIFKYLCNKNKNNYNKLISLLSKKFEIIVKYEKYNYINILKISSVLFNYCQNILYFSNSNFMTFFKYDYSKGYIALKFLFTINNKGLYFVDNTKYNLSLSSNIVNSKLLKCDNNFNYLYIDDIKDNNEIYSEFKERNIYKIYYKNLYNDIHNELFEFSSDRFGFFLIAYSKEHIMSYNEEKFIINIIQNIKSIA